MKKFFKGLKTDAKFAKAGEGHKLTEDTRTYVPSDNNAHSSGNIRSKPLTATQVQAGSAAIARHDQQSKQNKTVIPKVIKTKKAEDEPTSSTATNKEVGNPAESNIKFHSPFGQEIIKKADLIQHIHECLVMRLSKDGLNSSCLMIKTLNRSKDKVDSAIAILQRYLDNVIAHPDDEKYLRIRRNNKVFSSKVSVVGGCEEFLEAVGFKRMAEGGEMIFVMTDVNINNLKEAKDTLNNTIAIKPMLYRDKQILQSTGILHKLELSNDFYELTLGELKQIADEKSEEAELNLQLRTKAMREGKKTKKKSLFTIIRVKFPDGNILQGTFAATDTVGELMQFVRENINVEWAVFTLETALREGINNEESTLLEADLVPTAVLNLSWNEEIKVQVQQNQGIDLALNL